MNVLIHSIPVRILICAGVLGLAMTACTLTGRPSGAADEFLKTQSLSAGTNFLDTVKPLSGTGFRASGTPFVLSGVSHARGVTVTAPSKLTYPLGAQCRAFSAQIGVDDAQDAVGSATFKVLVDGRPMFDSGAVRAGMVRAVRVNVEGGEQLSLQVSGDAPVRAAWAEARLEECVVYKAPIEVIPYGSGTLTVTGNYRSDNPDVPAIRISTEQPVVIQNCVVAGRGHLIANGVGTSYTQRTNVTVQNCRGYGLNPQTVMREPGRFVVIQEGTATTIRNNFLKNTSGIYIFGTERRTNKAVTVTRNRALNIDGRRSDGKGGWLVPDERNARTAFGVVQFVQLNGLRDIPTAEISWNRVDNEPGYSRVEDNISIYASTGQPGQPIKVHHNLIRGAYAYPPTQSGYSGGGIITDGCLSRHVDIGHNTVLDTSNHGIAIANGEAVAIHDNVVLGTGTLPDGGLTGGADNGIYVRWSRNCSQSGVNFTSNTVTGNTVGFAQPSPAQPNKRSDLYIASSSRGTPLAVQSGNTRVEPIDGPITTGAPTIIEDAVSAWQEMIGASGLVIGPQ